MKLIKNIFKKKVEATPEIEEVQEAEEPVEVREDTGLKCFACGMSIWGDQKVKTFQGQKYHVKPCWRDLLKDAKRQAFH